MVPSRASAGGQLPPDSWGRVKAVFLAALDVAEADRGDFVQRSCAGDDEVAREVLALLERDRLAGPFCEMPAAHLLKERVDASASMRLEPGTQLGAYELTGFVGAGGMGQVYRARDTRLGREVAIKVVSPEGVHGDAGRRLVKEARHISSLKHPNICTVYEIGDFEGTPFIAMELVQGRMLSELQRSGPPLPESIRYAIQVADALHHAHSRGIVHRDLKSSNVIVDPSGQAIVLDFGLATRLRNAGESSESLTATQHGPAGTLSHMAPEVLLGGRGDARSDIWSLGVLLYQLVNGRLPFSGRTAFETSSAILGERPAPMDRRIPLSLRLVIERCLARNPEERYQDAASVRDALHAILARRGWRIAARLLRPSRRNAVRAAAAVMIGVLALLAWRGAVQRTRAVTPFSFGTIAVLPLENSGGDASEDFYASGVTDALIAQLGGAGELRVISRASAIHASAVRTAPTEVGRRLGADAVLQGTFSRSADRVRLDLRLIDVARGKVLWSDALERSPRDILVLQAEAVRAVADGVRAALRPGAIERLTVVPSIRPDVYEAYLKGRYEWNRRTSASLALAMRHFTHAIDLDPTYAPAHAALADCYNQLGTVLVGTGSPREHRPRAEHEAIKALQIDPASSEAHAALGYVRHYQWRWAESEQAFLRAIDLNPSNTLARLWYANLLMSRKRFDEALRQAHAARDLDPFSLIVNTNIGWILTFAGQRDAAIAHLRNTVSLNPEYPQARWRLVDALMLAGRYDEALAELDVVLRLTNRSPASLSTLVGLYAAMGRHADAIAVRRELLRTADGQYVPAATMAGVYRALGDTDEALDWMERAYEEGSNWIAYMAVEPWNDPIRAHPRFQALLQRTGQQ